MKSTSVPFSKTGFFSNLVLDYLDEKPNLASLYKYSVSTESFSKVIADKKNQKIDRTTLVTVLREQYNNISVNTAVKNNIDALLSEFTFTIATAHQPNLFLGPLYFIYKIASVINLAKQIQIKNPANIIIPVYWMGSEDHDVAELAQVTLMGKKLEWNPQQSGAFGRMIAKDLEPLIDEIKELIGNLGDAEHIIAQLKEYYNGKNTIATATRLFVNSIFGKYGLVIVEGDDARLKTLYSNVIEDELLNNRSEKLITPVVNEMERTYTVQAKPRSINLFYLKEGMRNRIEKTGENRWTVVNSSISFSENELKKEIASYPEHFSPNVILRGLYQETILPNLAFVGGGAEVSYWLELKPLFDYYKVNYPIILLRSSCLIINKIKSTHIKKMGFSVEELFLSSDSLIKIYLRKTSSTETKLNDLREKLEGLFNTLKEDAIAIDPTLEASVMAEKAKADKGIEAIEQKIIRAEKRKQEQAVSQIIGIKDKFFPGNGLQERIENFIPFYTKYGEGLIEQLVESLDPLQKSFIVLSEE